MPAPCQSSSPPGSFAPRERGTALLAGGLILAGALIAYHNSFHVPLLLDDTRAITGNATIRQLWPLGPVLSPPKDSGVSGRPVLNLTFALNYAAGGLRVWGYHAFGLAIHFLAGLTLFGIVRRTLRKAGKSFASGDTPTLLALAVALLWIVHPLQTEAVTYLSERAETLMALFYLLTLYGFIRYAAKQSAGAPRGGAKAEEASFSAKAPADKAAGRNGWAVLSVLACLFGMATKESMVTAPVVIFLYDAIFVSGTLRQAWRSHGRLHSALAASWLFLAWLMIALSRRSVGFHQGVSSWDYALTECQAIARYLRLAFWPSSLVFDYGPVFVTSPREILPEAGVLLALLAGTVGLLRRAPALGFLGLWFFFILAPSSSFVPVALQPVAENRMYLPLAAVITGLVLAVHRLLGRRGWWLIAALVFACTAGTIHRNRDYRDELTLWSDTVAKRPQNSRAQNDLGDVLAHAGRLSAAITHYRLALQLAPGNEEIRYNLGKALQGSGRTDDARREYAEALRARPDDAAAHNQLGLVLSARGRLAEARAQLQEALRLRPAYGEAHTNLGVVDLQLGEITEAQGEFTEALRLNPADAEAHFRLGNLAAMSGRLPEAMANWEETLHLRPGDAEAHNNLAMALEQTGRIPEAIAHYREALRLKPDYALARNNLAALLGRQKSADGGN